MVCFSGLGDRKVLPGLGGNLGDTVLGTELVDGTGSRYELLPLTRAFSEDRRMEREGRCGSAGRDNSEYVTAGIVP